MAKFTKAAIMSSFMKLLNKTSFDKITVTEIVKDCGINRNTFYYNFEDIYALVDEILQEEVNKIVNQHKMHKSWNEGLIYAANFAISNKRAIYHLHNSVKRGQLEKYIYRVLFDVIVNFVYREAEGFKISDEDVKFIADFYCYALIGLLNKWLDNGMKEDFNHIIYKTGIMFDSNIKQALMSLSRIDSASNNIFKRENQ